MVVKGNLFLYNEIADAYGMMGSANKSGKSILYLCEGALHKMDDADGDGNTVTMLIKKVYESIAGDL